jgi:hypothetical protein
VKFRFFILLFLTAGFLQAQDPYYAHLNESNGLPSNAVYDIYQDSKGFIWFATNEGLIRYDGYEYKTFETETVFSKAGSNIVEDNLGKIWYETFDGNLFYTEKNKLIPFKNNIPTYYTPFGIIKNKLFCIQGNVINMYSTDDFSLLNTIPLTINILSHSFADSNHFYVFADNFLYKFNTDFKHSKTKIFDDNKLIPSIYSFNSHNIILNKYNETKQAYTLSNNKIKPKFELKNIELIQGCSFIDENYWILTPKGAYWYSIDGKTKNNAQPFFKNKNIADVIKDRNGNYWFATVNEGVFFVPNISNRMYLYTNHSFNKITKNKDKLYLGTKNDEILKIETSDLNQYTFIYKDKFNTEVTLLKTDSTTDNLLFFSKTFQIFDLKTNKNILELSNAFKDIVKLDSKYYAFTASTMCGLVKNPVYTNTTSEWDSIFNKTKHDFIPQIGALILDERGRNVATFNNCIYYSTNKGLFKFYKNGKKEAFLLNNEPFLPKNIETLNKQIIVLHANGKVYEIANEELKLIDLGINEPIISIKTSNQKLYLFTKENSYFAESLIQNAIKLPLYTGLNKIIDLEVIGNKHYLLLEKGLLVLENTSQNPTYSPPLFYINSIKSNNEDVELKPNFTLNYNQNNIKINYSLLNYGKENETKILTKLNDGDWTLLPSYSRTLSYPNLAPANYTIAFKTNDNEAIISTIEFEITKPIWQKNWFLIGIFILLALIIYVYFKWQMGLLLNKNKLLEEKIKLEQSLSKSMLTSIKSQMNPHFFYNALNTIQAYIYLEDKRNASNYLAKFSKLTRIILEMSEKETITLEDELQALKLYLELEKMRFTENFEYQIEVDNSLDLELIKIPSMIIQPHVENAIKHGLLHKTDLKKVVISFKKQQNNLEISIDDNGIGRIKSGELNKLKKDKHESFSTKANEKRLELINRGKEKKITLKITDKTDLYNKPMGTTILITIPL